MFESENHARIFNENVHAAHVVFADDLQRAVTREGSLPAEYRWSWKLTRLVAVYLVGRLLRTDADLERLMQRPDEALADQDALAKKLELLALVAPATRKR